MPYSSLIIPIQSLFEFKNVRLVPMKILPIPDINLRFLGTIVQNFRIIGGKETAAHPTWIEKIEQAVSDKLVPILRQNNMIRTYAAILYIAAGGLR